MAFGALGSALFFDSRDEESAKRNLLIAAEMGHIHAANLYASLLRRDDSQMLLFWLWAGRVAIRGVPETFISAFVADLNQKVFFFFLESGDHCLEKYMHMPPRFVFAMKMAPQWAFAMGRALLGHVNLVDHLIFG